MHDRCRPGITSICLLSLVPAIGYASQVPADIHADGPLREPSIQVTRYGASVVAWPTRWEVSSTGALAALESHGVPAFDIWS